MLASGMLTDRPNRRHRIRCSVRERNLDQCCTQKLRRSENWNCLGSNAEVNENGSVAGPRRPFSEFGNSSRDSLPTVLLTCLKFVRLSRLNASATTWRFLSEPSGNWRVRRMSRGEEVGPNPGVAARTPWGGECRCGGRQCCHTLH